MIDLHIHTTASSDGQHTPREIFEMAKGLDIEAIAFTDHNTVASIDEGFRLSEEFGIEFVPSIEINTIFEELDLHLLAYYVDHRDPHFIEWLESINEEKKGQALKRFEKLRDLGFVLEYSDVERFARGYIPSGATFLKAILSREENLKNPRIKPYIDGNRSESPSLNFYLDYLRSGKPAYVQLDVCDTVSAIRRVKIFGGIPVLAHPSDTPLSIIDTLVKEGLTGLEVYSSRHTKEEIYYFEILAEKYNLLITAGSDFHGKQIKPNVELACVRGNDYRLLQQMKDYKKACAIGGADGARTRDLLRDRQAF